MMASPQFILSGLLIGAAGAAGILQGLYREATRGPGDRSDVEQQLRIAAEEIELLKRENESLRSLARGGGELTVPQEFIDRTEKEFGLKFPGSPVIRRVSPEELRDRVSAAIESRFGPAGAVDRQQAWSLIGWLGPEDDLLAQLTAARSSGATAWFDDATGEAWMAAKTNLKNIPDQAALVGLLARILFHQHFPPAAEYAGDDAERAREALHHGIAAGAEARFLTEKARTAGFMPMKDDRDAKLILASLPPFIQGLTGFPSVEGRGFVDSLFLKGNEALHAAFRNPPQTTGAILRAGEISAHPVPSEPNETVEPFLVESAGQLGLWLWLKPAGDAGAAREISNHWKGDRYVLFPDGGDLTAVRWDIELDSSDATDRLQAMAGRLLAGGGKHHVSLVRTSPTGLRFLNTAEAATATRLGAQ